MANDLYGDTVEQLPPAPTPALMPHTQDYHDARAAALQADELAPTGTPAEPTLPATNAPNPYDVMFQAQDVGRQQQLRTSVVQAADTSPDRAADVQKLSTQTGISADIVARNYDAIKKRALLTTVPYAQIQRDSPSTAAFLSEPEHAAVAHDDMENLGALEWLLTAPSQAQAQAINAQRAAALRTKELMGTPLTQAERDELTEATYHATLGGELGAGKSWFRGAVTGTMKLAAFMAQANPFVDVGARIGSALTGGSVTGEAIGGSAAGVVSTVYGGALGTAGKVVSAFGLAQTSFEASAGPAYERYLALTDTTGRPLDVDIARAAAITEGAINGALMGSLPGATKLLAGLQLIPGVAQLKGAVLRTAIETALQQPTVRTALGTMMKRYAGNLSHGMALMVAQEGASILGSELAKTAAETTGDAVTFPHITKEEAAAQLWHATTNAAQSLALVSGVEPALAFVHDAHRAYQGEQTKAVITALGEGVTQSKTAQRLPAAAQAFLAQATKDGPVETVYAPLAAWDAHWKAAGVDPAEMAARVTGDPTVYDKAQKAGTDLPIPTARYATTLAATDHNGYFASELRLSPDAMNARESAAWLKEQQAQAAEPPPEPRPPTAVEQAHQALIDTQTQAGVAPDVAATNAALVRAGFGQMATDAGLDPAAIYAERGIRVAAPDAATAAEEPFDIDRFDQPARATAIFLGHGPDGPLYTVVGGISDRSTLTAEGLAKLGISVPETPDATGERLTGAQIREKALTVQAEIARATDQQPTRGPDVVAPAAAAPSDALPPEGSIVERAAALRAENPQIDQQAAEMRARATAAGRIPEPKGRPESPLGQAIVDTFNQPLFHGSPHDFDRFSMEKIGTGEGAQAYGHGLYFAENKDVAEGYQRSTSGGNIDARNYTRDGAILDSVGEVWQDAYDAVREAGIRHPDDARMIATQVQDWVSSGRQAETFMRRHEVPDALKPAYRAAVDAWKGVRYKKNPGRLYQVDIPDAHIAKMLDWDKPITEQSDHVQAAVQGLLSDARGEEDGWQHGNRYFTNGLEQGYTRKVGDHFIAVVYGPGETGSFKTVEEARAAVVKLVGTPSDKGAMTGESFYKDLSNALGSDEAASAALREAGVPGLRFLDQGSRARTAAWDQPIDEGTRNVVVFDDSIVTVTHKDGTPVTPAEREQFFQPQQADAGKRASITIGPDKQVTIDLFKDQDLTSFLHEGGHLFLEVQRDLAETLKTRDPATLTEGQGRLLANHQTLLKALGVEALAEKGTPERTAQHEQVAEWFEAYLMEGKAPSVELQPVFARMRAWFLDVYKALKQLNAPLTDEVRGVFDRMLASDQAIADAEARRGQPAMFLTAEGAGMTPERFALYRDAVETAHATAQQQLDQQLLSDVRREQTARWKAQQVETRATVERDVQQQPVYRALAAIRDGTHPDGTPLVEGQAPEPLKLSRAILVDRYGEAAVARFPAEILTRDGGLDPDVLAEGFGFASGDALLHAIDRAPAIADVVDRETQQRMLREHGSLLLDGTLPEKADVAVANDQREQVVRAEIAALWAREQDVSPFVTAGKVALAAAERERAYERRWFEAEAKLRIAIAQGRKQVEIDALTKEVQALKHQARGGAATIRAGIPSADAMREAARVRIEATTVRALKPQEFWSASRRAAQQAIDRAARQDFTGAITAKTQELLTLHLYRAAEAAKADVETRVSAAGRLDRPGTRKTLGLAGGGFLDQIDGVLDRFGFSPADQAVLDRKASIEAWQTAKQADGIPVDLPASVLNGEFRKPYADLTVVQFRDVTDALAQLAHLARAQGRTFKNAAADAFRLERDGLVASIRDKNAVHKLPLEFGKTENRTLTIANAIASLTKLSILARGLDGSEDGGPMWESLVRRANEASDAEQVRNVDTGEKMAAIIEQHYPGRERFTIAQRSEVPGVGSMSKEMRLAVALNWGTDTGQDRLLSDPTRHWSREQVESILGTLDRRDWSFVQDTWKLIGSFWPEIAAKQERVVGVAPEKVAGVTVHTKFGDVEGAYYPLKYDGRLASRAVQLELAGVAKMQQGAAYVRSTTSRGFVETRLTHVELPIRLELGVAFQHLGQVIHDLTHHEMLIDATRLLRDKQVSSAIYETAGSPTYNKLTSAFQDIAAGLAPATDYLDKGANFMRSGVQVASLGFNLMVGLKHPMGVFNGAALIGPGWMMKGIGRWVGDAAHMRGTDAWILENSPMMRYRGHTATQDLHDLAGEMRTAGGWFDALVRTVTADHLTQQTITNGYLMHIGLLQQIADRPTWLGGYEKAMDAQRRAGGGIDETRAFRLADQAVLDSQGGGTIKDLASVQRGTPVARLFLTFYSYGARMVNSTVEAAGHLEPRSPASVLKFMGKLSLLYLAPAMWNAALRQASGKVKSDEDAVLAFVKETGKDMLGAALNGIPYARELQAPLIYGREYTGTAGTQAFVLAANAIKQVEQEELDEPLMKSLNDVLGVVLGYPAAQVDRTIAGYEALRDGRTENPLALVSGGPPKK